MDILIKGMEMPTEKEDPFCILIFANGEVNKQVGQTISDYPIFEEIEDAKAVALPEHHGRLIDADALCNKLESPDFAYFSVARFESIIAEAETIVEATE